MHKNRGQGSGVSENKKSILSFGKNKKKNIKTITPGPEYSRRELLHFFREKAVEKAVEKVTGVKNMSPNASIGDKKIEKGGNGEEQCIPERRKILMDALKGSSALQPAQVEEGKFPVHQIKIEGNCTLCHTCSVFCPTGALTRLEGDSEVRLDFNMSLCMDCFECTELCPDGAMSKEKTIDLALFNNEVKTLFKKGSEKCPSCNRQFFPEDGAEECNICRKRNYMDDMMFGFASKGSEIQENNLTK